jgi:hypothetical protein
MGGVPMQWPLPPCPLRSLSVAAFCWLPVPGRPFSFPPSLDPQRFAAAAARTARIQTQSCHSIVYVFLEMLLLNLMCVVRLE